jgi:hypothetical protein
MGIFRSRLVVRKLFIALTALRSRFACGGATRRPFARGTTLVNAGRDFSIPKRECAFAGRGAHRKRQDQRSRSPLQVQAHAPAGTKTIDLGGATLLPGLIDSHTHLLLDVTLPTEAEGSRRYNGAFATPGCCWQSQCRPANAYCAARNWHARTWRVASRRCAISGTPALMETCVARCHQRRPRRRSENTGFRHVS